MPGPNDQNRKRLLICAGLSLVILVTFWPVIHCGFVNYDDPYYVLQNSHIQQGFSINSLGWAFTTGHAGNWHPLTWISHILDVNLFGLNPAGHHLTNLILHVLNANLVFLIFLRMSGAIWRSALVAALFALHPLHVESVAWISERKDVLSTFFWGLTLLAYLGYVARPTVTKYLLIAVSFSLGLMAKPMLVTVPCLLLLLDFWPLRRIATGRRILGFDLSSPDAAAEGAPPLPRVPLARLIVEKIPLFLLTAISCLVTVWAQRRTVMPLEGISVLVRICNAMTSYCRYVYKMIWPQRLIVHYPYPGLWSIWPLLLVAFTLASFTYVAIRLARLRPYVIVGWLWFLGTLIPTIGLIQVGTQSMADRYSYVPLIGLFLIIAWGAYDLSTHLGLRSPVLAGAGMVVLAACAATSRSQLAHWRSGRTLFQHAVNIVPDDYLAQYNLGVATLDEGDLDRARELFEKSAHINPAFSEAWNNLANALVIQGRPAEAIECYSRALKYRPDHGLTHYNMGLALAELGNRDQAIAHFQTALRLSPDFSVVFKDLGHVLVEKGELPQALTYLREYVRRAPNDAEGRVRLAEALKANQEQEAAQEQYSTALALQPELPQKYATIARGLGKAGKVEAAIDRYSTLMELQKRDPTLTEEFGIFLADHGRLADAMARFKELLRLRPDAQAHYDLGLVLVMQDHAKEAVEQYRQALELKADFTLVLNDLAWILATHKDPAVRNGAEAVRLAERACQLAQNQEARYWGTLDAAYAETGRFQDAIQAADKARELALASGQPELAAAAGKRQDLYRAKRPFHQD